MLQFRLFINLCIQNLVCQFVWLKFVYFFPFPSEYTSHYRNGSFHKFPRKWSRIKLIIQLIENWFFIPGRLQISAHGSLTKPKPSLNSGTISQKPNIFYSFHLDSLTGTHLMQFISVFLTIPSVFIVQTGPNQTLSSHLQFIPSLLVWHAFWYFFGVGIPVN